MYKPTIDIVESIYPVGEQEVWDLTVENDHSYLAQGLFHHNSDHPNLQNVAKPKEIMIIDKKITINIRKAFEIREDELYLFQLLLADWSQIEMRILAEESGDETMINAFKNNKDLHTETAIKVFGITKSDLDPKDYYGPNPESSDKDKTDWIWNNKYRFKAKAVNFGLIYGLGPKRFAREQNMTIEEGDAFFKKYFSEFPGVQDYNNKCTRFAKKHGYIKTRFGIKHPLKEQDAYKATNSAIQGASADMNKITMKRVYDILKTGNRKSVMVNNVHDELTTKHFKNEIDVPKLIIDCMEDWPEFKVPITADVSIAWPSWGDKRDLTKEEKQLYNIR